MLFKKKEDKKAAKKATPAKKAAAKPVAKKAAAKPAAKKPAAKAATKKVVKEEVNFRNYHVVKRPADGKWEVKFAGGSKAIKLFDTQAEAIAYSKKMAENQDGVVLVHNSKGASKGRIKSK